MKECDRYFSKQRSPNHQIRDHATYPLASLWQVQGGQQVSAGVLLDGTRTRRSREALRNQGDISTRRTDSPRRAGFVEAPHESTHSLQSKVHALHGTDKMIDQSLFTDDTKSRSCKPDFLQEGNERLKCPPPDSQTEPERVGEQEVFEEPQPSGVRGQTAHQAGQISQGVPKDWKSAKEDCNQEIQAKIETCLSVRPILPSVLSAWSDCDKPSTAAFQ